MGEVGVANGLAALVEHPSGCKLDRLQVRLKASKVVRLQSRQEAVGAMPGGARAWHGSQVGHGGTAFVWGSDGQRCAGLRLASVRNPTQAAIRLPTTEANQVV